MGRTSKMQEPVRRWAWALWTELGVHGPERLHPDVWIDVERLAHVTFTHLREDSRLVGEASAWLEANERFVSVARLRRLGTDIPEARRARPSIENLDRPGRTQLLLRATFGVSSRAEILGLLEFKSRSRAGVSTADIASEVLAGKRNVEVELDALRLAGLVVTDKSSRPSAHFLTTAGRNMLAELPGSLPQARAEWGPVLAVIEGLFEAVSRIRLSSSATHPVIIQEALEKLQAYGPRTGLSSGVRFPPEAGLGRKFEIWCADQLRAVLLGNFGVRIPRNSRAVARATNRS